MGLQFISGQHPSTQLLFPCRSGKDAFNLGRGIRLPHPSPCLSLVKTKPLLYLRKYTEMAGGSSNERKTTVPPTMKSPCLKKKRGKKREGDTPTSPPPPSFCAQWHANDSPVTAQLGPLKKGWGLELLKAPSNYCQSEPSFCSSPLPGKATLSRSRSG